MRIILVVIAVCVALFGVEKMGERRGQKWADDWYAGSPRMPKDDTLHERAFHRKHERIMEQHKEMLVKAGRITDPEHFMASEYLGTYGWYSGICDDSGNEKPSPCSFGAYTFSQAAFEQAKRLYILYGQMASGSDLLIDVGAGAFDKDAVGYTVPYLTYCELIGGKLEHCEWGGTDGGIADAKVVEFIDKNTVRLDKKAKWNAAMYGLVVRPPDFIDMCNCTVSSNGFSGAGTTQAK